MKFAIYASFEAAQKALDECNSKYLPTIFEVKNNVALDSKITKSWAAVDEYEEGWGFPLPNEMVWTASESVVENATLAEKSLDFPLV